MSATPSPPLLSIVIFTRDDGPHLRACLACLAESPPAASFEVIVVDNASRDDTAAVVEESSDRLTLRSVVLEVDSSFSAGNNLGLQRAEGEVVLFLNPDTLPVGEAVDRCLAVVRGDAGVGVVSPRLTFPDGAPQPTGWSLPTPRQLLREHVARDAREVAAGASPTTEVGWLMGCFLMGNRAFLAALGGFDEAFWFHGTDLELCARVGNAGRTVVRVEDCSLVHVGHRAWGAERRAASHEALVRWLRRDHGPVSAELVSAAARLAEALRR